MQDSSDDTAAGTDRAEDLVVRPALGASLEFFCILLLDERDGDEECFVVKIWVGGGDLGSQLVIALESDVADGEKLGFSALLYSTVFAASHGEEKGQDREISHARMERC